MSDSELFFHVNAEFVVTIIAMLAVLLYHVASGGDSKLTGTFSKKHITVMTAVRYLSYVFAAGKASDKIILLARTVESDPWIQERSEMHTWLPWHLWHWQ